MTSSVFRTAVLLVLAAAFGSAEVRLRRNWAHLAKGEQDLFLEGVQAMVDSGAYADVAERHARTDEATLMHANDPLAVMLWHRLLVQRFEDSLLNSGEKFANLTVPYWDWASEDTSFLDENSTGGRRAQCVRLRADKPCLRDGDGDLVWRQWNSHVVRLTHSQLVDWSKYEDVSKARGVGPFNERYKEYIAYVHPLVGGTMGLVTKAAYDPIFWLHHSFVDRSTVWTRLNRFPDLTTHYRDHWDDGTIWRTTCWNGARFEAPMTGFDRSLSDAFDLNAALAYEDERWETACGRTHPHAPKSLCELEQRDSLKFHVLVAVAGQMLETLKHSSMDCDHLGRLLVRVGVGAGHFI